MKFIIQDFHYLCSKFYQMKKKLLFGLMIVGLASLNSCGNANESEANENATDTTATNAPAETHEEESTELAFDGVDKGDYTLYGHTEIEPNGNAITVTEMNDSIVNSGGFEGKVNVNIDEVCQKAGCWITFNNGEAKSVRVFFKDHFTIPTNTAAGTEAILYGKAVVDTLSVDFQKHLLDDAAESGKEVAQEEYDSITEDLIETTFECEAILVKK